MLKLALVSCVLLASVLGDIDVYDRFEVPEEFSDQEGCYIPEFDKMFQLREAVASTEECKQYRCIEEGIEVETCPDMLVEEDNESDEDNGNQPYPLCCPAAGTS